MLRVRRVLQIFKEWFSNFLQARGMSKANGQMLFRYRATQAEYQELKGIFSDRFKTLSGALGSMNPVQSLLCLFCTHLSGGGGNMTEVLGDGQAYLSRSRWNRTGLIRFSDL